MDTKLFYQIENALLNDEAPSGFIEEISLCEEFLQFPFTMLVKMKGVEQSKTHHPEGDVWRHTMLVVNEAAKRKDESKNPRVFMWAALLHDIGKPDTTKIKKGKITSYDHDKVGAKLAKTFLQSQGCTEEFINEVSGLVRYHMQILFVVKGMPFAEIENMKLETDVSEVALLGLCDRLGRLNVDVETEKQNIKTFIEKV